MKQNLVALSVNIARAYEIGIIGNHSLSIIPANDPDNERQMNENCKTLREFYKASDSRESDMVIELHNIPYSDILASYSGRGETMQDITSRIEETMQANISPTISLSGAVGSLLKVSTEKLSLSIKQVNQIISVSKTIALMSGSKEVKPEHIAEAIQYQSAVN